MLRPRAGHVLALLQGADAYFDAVVAELDRSVQEVWFETYIYHQDPTGERLTAALVRAAERGVRVHLTVDGVGTPEMPQPWLAAFARAGVRFHVFLPLGRFGLLMPGHWRRLHRKLCVVDGRVAFCGGINVLDDRVDPNHGPLHLPRLDFGVRVEGPLVTEVHETLARSWLRLQLGREVRGSEFAEAWRDLQGSLQRVVRAWSRPAPVVAAVSTVIGARASFVLRDNLRHRRKIEAAYLAAISASRQEVVIANAYFLPGRRLRRALVQAARRGVRVRLLLQGRYEYFLQYHASRPVYGALLAAGVEIHEYTASFLHAKVAVVDGYWATVGSSNLDPLSLLMAREANVVVQDAAFADGLRASLEQAIGQGSRAVDPGALAGRPWHERAKDLVAYGLMRLALLLLGRRY